MPHPVTKLPLGYEEAEFLHITEGKRLVWLNIIAFGMLVVAGVAFFGWLIFYETVLQSPFIIDQLPKNLSQPVGLGLVLLVIPLHEILHGVGIAYYGHQVRYGVKLMKGVIYATTDHGLFWRRQFVVVALVPLVVISIVAILLSMIVPPGIGVWLMLAASINTAGAVGDLWMVQVAYRHPANILIRDEEDGMRIFAEMVK